VGSLLMMKANGFGQGFVKSPVMGQGLSLGQTPKIATRSMAAGGGEPDIARVLTSIASDEAAEYRTWTSAHKSLFLMGYQWLAAAAAKDLLRLDDGKYTGFFQQGLDAAMGALDAGTRVELPDSASAALLDATSILKDGKGKTLPRVEAAVRKYRLLRDRIAWELSTEGDSVDYEIVGDDPQNPGMIFTKRMGGEGPSDVDAVYSKLTPQEAMSEGDALEEMFAGMGVPFKRFDLSGANLGDVGQMPVLALTITLVVGVLTFYYLYKRSTESANLNEAIISGIMADKMLSSREKADLIEKVKASESFFNVVFGSSFSWTTLIIGSAIFGIAFFVLPGLVEKSREAN
jgi:hypothetical protein